MINTETKLNQIINSKENYLYFDLAGSGKSRSVIAAINNLSMRKDEIIVWCGYSKSDLLEKQKYITQKSIIVTSDRDETNFNIDSITDEKVILMPVQFYRKFYPTDIISKKFTIKKVIIDELSYIDFIVPSLLDENFVYGEKIEDIIKTKFSKFDLHNQRKKIEAEDQSPSYAHFISNSKLSHIVLTTEYLTRFILEELGWSKIVGDEAAQRDCVVKIYLDSTIKKTFIDYSDDKDLWGDIGYDHIFCNASKDNDFVTTHTTARGSNKYIGKKCLTVFRRFGYRFEFSFKSQMERLLNNENSDMLLHLYYTDQLNQTVSRTVGYRGDKVGYVVAHPNCGKIILKQFFPYQIEMGDVDIYNKDQITSLIKKVDNIDLSFTDELIFDPEKSMPIKEFKKICGFPATKAVKLLNSLGYDVKTHKTKYSYLVIGCEQR